MAGVKGMKRQIDAHESRLPIDRFCAKHGVEMDLARCLIGRNEAETERNFDLWSAFLGQRQCREQRTVDIGQLLEDWIIIKSAGRKTEKIYINIAMAIGTSEHTVTYWLNCNRWAKDEWVNKLAVFFGITAEEFLRGPACDDVSARQAGGVEC